MNIRGCFRVSVEMLMAMQSQADGKNRMSSAEIEAIVGKIRNMPAEPAEGQCHGIFGLHVRRSYR